MIALSLFVVRHSALADECLEYEPTSVSVTGELHRATFPGRPNYSNFRAGDEAEVYYVLKPIKPICVRAGDAGDFWKTDKSDIDAIQLILDAKKYKKYRPLLRHKVTATGTLMPQMTGHHHTAVLLDVTGLKIAEPRKAR